MGPLSKSLWLSGLLCLSALVVVRRSRPAAHNPLELWAPTGDVSVAVGGNSGISIRCNVSTLEGTHQWVEVAWSGLDAGPPPGGGAPVSSSL
jgi:hypothetical protein